MSLPPDFEERFRGFEEAYRSIVEERVAGRYLDLNYVVSKLESLCVELESYVISRLAGIKDEVCVDVYGFVDSIFDSADYKVLAITALVCRMYSAREPVYGYGRFDVRDLVVEWLERVLCR